MHAVCSVIGDSDEVSGSHDFTKELLGEKRIGVVIQSFIQNKVLGVEHL